MALPFTLQKRSNLFTSVKKEGKKICSKEDVHTEVICFAHLPYVSSDIPITFAVILIKKEFSKPLCPCEFRIVDEEFFATCKHEIKSISSYRYSQAQLEEEKN